jgi:hypothetical protein
VFRLTPRVSLFSKRSDRLCPHKPPIQWLPGVRSAKVKWPVHEAGHSPQTNVIVKNEWSYTSTSVCACTGKSPRFLYAPTS